MSSVGDQLERALDDMERPEEATDEQPMEVDTPPDRTRQMTHTGFSRMRMTWGPADGERLEIVRGAAREIISQEFRVVDVVMSRLHRRVREPLLVIDEATGRPTGEIRTYPDGSPMWVTDEDGVPAENWGAITADDRSWLMWTIVSWLREWEMKAVDAWAEAMFAKVAWEEKFARGFVAMPGSQPAGKPTIDDRRQWGQQFSAEERYFAVFRAYLSKAADAQVRSMNRMYRMLEAMTI